MKNYIELKGVKEVNGWIGVQMKDTDRSLRNIMKGTALVIMDAAKRTAPVITGRYRSSIHIEYGGDTDIGFEGKSMFNEDQKFEQSPEAGEIFVGTNVVYAGAVERKHQTIENATTSGQWYLTRKINELTRR